MKKKILFWGEKENNLEKIQDKLHSIDYEMNFFSSSFVNLMKEIDEYKPNILLLDSEMFKTSEELNTLHKKYSIPIILLLSSYLSEDEYLKKMNYVSCFLEKPIKPYLLIFTIQDIIHKLKLKEVYELRRLTVNAMIDNNSDAGIIINISGKIEYANNNFCKMVGLTKYKVINRMCHEILDGVYISNSKRIIQKILSQSNEVDLIEILKGHTYEYKIIPIKKKDGEIFNIAIFIKDITKIRETENRILQLSKALETMQLGVFILDLDQKIRYSNRAAAEMHGYTLEEMIGEPVCNFLSGIDKKFYLEQFDLSHCRIPVEINSIRKNGDIFPTRIISDILFNEK